MGKRIEYQPGEQIGELIYIKDVKPYCYPMGGTIRKALFQCQCGKRFETLIINAKRGATKSCGCLHYLTGENSKQYKHGLIHHPLYRRWRKMIERCYVKQDPSYKVYGGRGIVVCDEWRNDFKTFYDYATKLPHYGEPGMTLDRIDNNGDYEPGNLRWASRFIQARNRRSNRMIIYKGESKPLTQWADEFGLNPHTLWHRLNRGWPIHDALTLPLLLPHERKKLRNEIA